jgi:hypothetical protein
MGAKLLPPLLLAAAAAAVAAGPLASSAIDHCDPETMAAVCPASAPDQKHTEDRAEHEQASAAQTSAASGDVTIALRGQSISASTGKLARQLTL